MPERLFIDEDSKLPLPILPHSNTDKHLSGRSDWHHHFYHRNDERLQDEGGKAVRHSRMQLVPRSLHERYHDQFRGADIPLPSDRASQFYVAVLSLARYLPKQAVDVSGREPTIVNLDDRTHQRIRSQEIKPQWSTAPGIGAFIMKFSLEQNLDHIDERIVDEFVYTKDERRQRALGHFLVAKAVEVGVEPIDPLYREGWQNGLVPPELPDDPVACVQRLFEGHAPDYFDVLSERLVAA